MTQARAVRMVLPINHDSGVPENLTSVNVSSLVCQRITLELKAGVAHVAMSHAAEADHAQFIKLTCRKIHKFRNTLF